MTDQVPTEYVHFEGEGYILLRAERGFFSPWDHDIRPDDADSSNWAGFVAHFVVHDRRLYLDYLTVGHIPATKKRSPFEGTDQLEPTLDDIIGDYVLPPLNGVEPTNAGMGYWHYQNINLALDYTGAITLGSEPTQKQPDHLELTFEQGHLVSVKTIPAPIPDATPWAETESLLCVTPSEDFDFDNPRSNNGKDSDNEPPQQP
ncbi:hypothetical protein BKP64_08970 [Marinobacter salinus]|uniref:Uncharacterized protein n=1 Tax=Marinobacter salinus TaxID=1874317 RepID=A0A1D9GL83_9GAMM|nr:hypothetical protein [Marinobacter salinus]AOY88284.1 hypothetical protein BKP64_08970 [Marinobacter salinus]